jgi:hypothetical protein
MESPSVIHPKKFRIDGIFFEVITATPVSDEQAGKIAMHFYKSRKFKKPDKGKLFQVVTLFDSESTGLL